MGRPPRARNSGDAFCGTLAAALCQGRERAKAMELAAQAASANVLHPGAQPPLPAASPRGRP